MLRAIAVLCLVAGAQTLLAADPAFEVASVRPASGASGGIRGGPGTKDPDRISYMDAPMEGLLTKAFSVRHDQIIAPSWISTQRFDIAANVPPGTSAGDFASMLRNLLVERFAIAYHIEKRDYLSYSLVTGKNGFKLKESNVAAGPARDSGDGSSRFIRDDPTTTSLNVSGGTGHLRAVRMSMPELAWMLGNLLDRRVADQTGLAGTYDFTLTFPAPGTSTAVRAMLLYLGGTPQPESPDTDLGIFDALQNQLGLKLERTKGPADFLVIDHIEKTPTDN